MAKRSNEWIECPECQEEYEVVGTSTAPISFCCYCGSGIEPEDEEIEDYEE